MILQETEIIASLYFQIKTMIQPIVKMIFPDNRRCKPEVLQVVGNRFLIFRERGSQQRDTGGMGIFSGQQALSGGTAEGRIGKSVGKYNPFAGKPVKIRGPDEIIAQDSQYMIGMIISYNDHHVPEWARFFLAAAIFP
jgi:hypothetical protein